MPNNFFRFKQFTVQQGNCAMKVCTDACLFGAITTKHFQQIEIKNVLDIGTGTGLLSLMLAQKINATIDAIEIDEQAAMQAAYNFQHSGWQQRLHMHHTAIQQFENSLTYGLIICNPPFYDNDLKSPDKKRNAALHSSNLNFEELITAAKKFIAQSGTLAVLLPFHRSANFEQLAITHNFYLNKKILIRQTLQHHFFRAVLFFSLNRSKLMQEEISIEDTEKKYSHKFCELLQDYYLNL